MTGVEGRPLERRRLLGLIGAGVLAGGAGCIGDDGADEADEERTVEPNMEYSGEGPVEFDGEFSCPICGMSPADYEFWHSQVRHEDGAGAVCDTSGCMFAYLVINDADAPVADAWTVDSKTRDLIDATEAHFVIITDETAVDDPMKINPRSFADRDDAVAFLEEYEAEDLSEDEDVIEFDEIDRETAEIYRGNRM